MRKKRYIYTLALALALALAGCDTTSNMTDGEYLYTGIERIRVEDIKTIAKTVKSTPKDSLSKLNPSMLANRVQALADVKAALDYAPNNSFMGSSSVRVPFPVGLWFHNKLVKNHDKGFNKWLYNTFATTPITIAAVSPETRTQVATSTLQNYGYFQGTVDYRIVDQKDPKKKKIEYIINMGDAYQYDSIRYVFRPKEDSIRKKTQHESLLHVGDAVNVANLQAEKERLTEELRDNGFYFFRPDYINYYADSLQTPKKVTLLVGETPDIPANANHQWYMGKVEILISPEQQSGSGVGFNMAGGQRPAVNGMTRMRADMDSVTVRGITVKYFGDKCPISPAVLIRNLRLRRGRMFSQRRIDQTLENISNMQTFSSIKFAYTPRDTTSTCDTLDVRLTCVMDKLIDAEFDASFTQKSNAQVGPSASLTIAKRNAFGHGETFSINAKGSYEWQTGDVTDGKRVDSYEAGIDASIKYPFLAFPGLKNKRFRFASSSKFSVGFDHLKRAGYYRLLQLHASSEYSFKSNRYYTHKITPLSLTYNKLEDSTEKFDSIVSRNKALYASLSDQLIPAVAYSITYDNSWKNLNFQTWAELTVKESGNLTSGIMSMCGRDMNTIGKKLLNVPFSQFVKTTLEIKHRINLTPNSGIATRFYAGAVFCYGNSEVAPYSELFYAGGANDIRAFGAHTIGPGAYYDKDHRGTYMDQAGSLKLELNAEYRFKVAGNLYGAVFLDAGNAWNLKQLDSHPGGCIRDGGFFKSVATGTGLGVRYDMDYLVLRFDTGIAIHAPYDTGKSGYYNIPKFYKDGVAFHFAVGYPF